MPLASTALSSTALNALSCQEHRLSFGDFVEQVLQLQKSNTAAEQQRSRVEDGSGLRIGLGIGF